MRTEADIAASLREIAAHAKPGLIVDGEQRMVIELSHARLLDIITAAGMLQPDEAETEGMGL